MHDAAQTRDNAAAPRLEPLVLRLFGPADASTETGLRLQLRRAARSANGRQLIVDLSDVPFVDAAGLAALIEAQALTGNRLTIHNPPRSLTRILEALSAQGQFAASTPD